MRPSADPLFGIIRDGGRKAAVFAPRNAGLESTREQSPLREVVPARMAGRSGTSRRGLFTSVHWLDLAAIAVTAHAFSLQ